ncbi:hypothetical protein [Jannaschia sp. LMIT008]|uniref:hypothetical protein n=1 Tax=Jannaschia maritima TaxID=3032585 RepID=UPI0028114C86|nr:hypothetical protein [Jannaschia sp. LMIT008]
MSAISPTFFDIRGAPIRSLIWSFACLVPVVAAATGAWLTALAGAGCVILALLPKAFTRVSGLRFPDGLCTGVLVFCMAALLLGEMAGFYGRFWWWDLGLHVVASVVLVQVGAALVLLVTAGGRPRTAIWILATLAFGFSMMVGACWEIFEFTIDGLFGTNAQRSGLPDTMWDLVADAVGATWGAWAVNRRLTHGSAPPGAGLLPGWMTLNPIVYPDWPEWSVEGRAPRGLAR